MKRTLLSFILAITPFLIVISQTSIDQGSNDWKKHIYIEAGYIYPDGTIKESVAIRQNISYYYVNQNSDGYVSSTSSGLVAGIRYEYFYPRFKSGISAGIRFIGFNTEISGYTSSISDFFYLRYSMEDNDTKFARVKSLEESNYILTVPLEILVVPITYKYMGLYLKAGFEYSVISFNQGSDIIFQNETMEAYEESILNNISGAVNKRFSTFYTAIGFKFGKENMPNLMFEISLPSLFLTENNFTLVDSDYYQGFKLAIQFPLNKK
jgi:hypothetical protein